MEITNKTSLLRLLAQQNPIFWEIIGPHVPKTYLSASLLFEIAKEIEDNNQRRRINEVAHELKAIGIREMTAHTTMVESN